MHPENAPLPIYFKLTGKLMLTRFLHPENASLPIFARFTGKLMLDRIVFFLNTLSPICVTLSGTTISVSFPLYLINVPFSLISKSELIYAPFNSSLVPIYTG
jgi:hypothetical protein